MPPRRPKRRRTIPPHRILRKRRPESGLGLDRQRQAARPTSRKENAKSEPASDRDRKRLLHAHGADPSSNGNALWVAVRSKRIDIVRLLLDRGVPVNAVDFESVCYSCDPELIQLFLDRGADPINRKTTCRARELFAITYCK
jgi:hypothetical protein